MLLLGLIFLLNLNLAYSITWYGNFAHFSSWDLRYSLHPQNRVVVIDPLGGGDMVLRVKYPVGSYSSTVPGGTAFYVYVFPNMTYGHASFEYDVLFPNDWEVKPVVMVVIVQTIVLVRGTCGDPVAVDTLIFIFPKVQHIYQNFVILLVIQNAVKNTGLVWLVRNILIKIDGLS